jgi:hypothetical protein
MAVVKAAVDVAVLSSTGLSEALAFFGLAPAPHTDAAQKLHNGYSGCNYRVDTVPAWLPERQQKEETTEETTDSGAKATETAGSKVVLVKGSVDKPVAELVLQVELLRHLRTHGFATAAPLPGAAAATTACGAPCQLALLEPTTQRAPPPRLALHANPVRGRVVRRGGGCCGNDAPAGVGGASPSTEWVTTVDEGTMAVMLLDFLPGTPANQLISGRGGEGGGEAAGGRLSPATVLSSVGTALAQLHRIPPPASGVLRRYAGARPFLSPPPPRTALTHGRCGQEWWTRESMGEGSGNRSQFWSRMPPWCMHSYAWVRARLLSKKRPATTVAGGVGTKDGMFDAAELLGLRARCSEGAAEDAERSRAGLRFLDWFEARIGDLSELLTTPTLPEVSDPYGCGRR